LEWLKKFFVVVFYVVLVVMHSKEAVTMASELFYNSPVHEQVQKKEKEDTMERKQNSKITQNYTTKKNHNSLGAH
jgi:hypothetical protein